MDKDKQMNRWKYPPVIVASLVTMLVSAHAEAHWCDDLWESAYNIVVRPASDTITVPASGTAKLEIFVQNNMGYALPNFELVADLGGVEVQATRGSQKVAGTLFPGEKAKYSLAISKGGGGQVSIEQINFSVHFGEGRQWGMYPAPDAAKATVIKKASGELSPAAPVSPAPIASRGQSKQLVLAAMTDFIDLQAGLDGLMQLYCAGRGSWNSNSVANLASWCPNTATTNCQTRSLGTSSGTKYDYPKLWATVELAARKASLGCARMAVLRDRLKCGIADPNLGFSGFAMIVLGYLGEDPGTRTFIQEKIDAGGELGTIAKAALLLFGNAADKAKYLAEVQAGSQSANHFVACACAAALGIAMRDDARVNSILVPRAEWIEPDTSDNGQAMYAAHLIALVAWDRRGFAPNADDKGVVTFFEGGTPTPFVPGEACPGSAAGTGGTVATGGVVAHGGMMGTGGITSNGGSVTSGGTLSSGGVIASGGIALMGGNRKSGGTVATGGTTSTGGKITQGGARATTGGTTPAHTGGAGGTTGPNAGTITTDPLPSAGSAASTSGSPSGCSVSRPVNASGVPLVLLTLLLGLTLRRIKRRDR